MDSSPSGPLPPMPSSPPSGGSQPAHDASLFSSPGLPKGRDGPKAMIFLEFGG